MKKIWKFELEKETVKLHLPRDYKVVHVGVDNRYKWSIWIEGTFPIVDGRGRLFGVFGTGLSIDEHAEHVGTFFDGDFVWHVYMTGVWG